MNDETEACFFFCAAIFWENKCTSQHRNYVVASGGEKEVILVIAGQFTERTFPSYITNLTHEEFTALPQLCSSISGQDKMPGDKC